MAHLDLVDPASADDHVRPILEETEAKWGYLPEIVRALALHPPALDAEAGWTDAIMHEGVLDRRLKELVATTVSAVNDCEYCAVSHGYQAAEHGASADAIRACRDPTLGFEGLTDAEAAAVAFARTAAADIHAIDAEDVAGLAERFSRQEVVELVLVVASFQLYNTFVELLGLELEGPLASFASRTAPGRDG